MQRPTWPRQVRNRLRVAGGLEISPATPGDVLFMTWLLCEKGDIFYFLHTKFIFREIIVRTGTIACTFQTKMGSVGI